MDLFAFRCFGVFSPNKVSGLISGLLTGIGSSFLTNPFAIFDKWICSEGQYHLVLS